MKLALGPILYYWPRQTVFDFYHAVALAPVDIVYLGETVCSRRHELRVNDWLKIADMLADTGKQVILSTQTLTESESDLKIMRRIVANGRYMVEANDMGAVRLLAGRGPFVGGPSLNIYNAETLAFFAALGLQRWVAPIETSRAQLATMRRENPPGIETEIFIYGRLPLAQSARCFTARRFNLQKDTCGFRCLDFPEGLVLHTCEGQPLLTLNGTQTQSAAICNLMRALPTMAEVAVDVIRISPAHENTVSIIDLFRCALDAPQQRIEAIAAELDAITPQAACDGFWHGIPGMNTLHPLTLQ
jgi:collagenase-like PrtC family protease